MIAHREPHHSTTQDDQPLTTASVEGQTPAYHMATGTIKQAL